MDDSDKKIDANFFQLVASLQIAAMQQMGKIASPITGKVERNLKQAQASIEMLAMLSEKTANNLTEEERKFIDQVLYELRMNFVDESKKPEEAAEVEEKEQPREPASESDTVGEKTSEEDNA